MGRSLAVINRSAAEVCLSRAIGASHSSKILQKSCQGAKSHRLFLDVLSIHMEIFDAELQWQASCS